MLFILRHFYVVPVATWLQTLRSCPSLKSSALDIKCKRNNQDVSCTGLIFTGTKAYLNCKALTHPEVPPNYHYSECKANGEWDKPLFKCVPDCGQAKISALVQHGSRAKLGEFPWQVAIYRTSRNNTLICGGTLISKTRVISAAHCFFNEELGVSTANLPHEYEVIVAKVTSNYSSQDNKYQQKLKVKKIIQHENEYNPSLTGHYGADIIILQLEKPVVISRFVLPACFAWGDRVGFNPGRDINGVVAGWGLDERDMPSEYLRYAVLPFISYNECGKKIRGVTNDKFCAGSRKGAKPSLGDSGGGIVFRNSDNLFYIRGIVSTEDRYNNLSVVTFTDVSNFKEWIQRNFDDGPPPTTKAKPSAIINVPIDAVPTEPPKPKPCPSLHPPHTDVKCYPKMSNQSISCEGDLAPGSRIIQRCISFYHPKSKEMSKMELTCQDSGEWDGPPLTCVVDCGYPASSTTTLVSGGKIAVFGDHPWTVAIYRLHPGGDDATLICGGTIISPTLVLSAASCFYNKTEKKLASGPDVANYEFFVSKFSIDYKKIDSGIQKKYKIKELIGNNRPTYNPVLTGVHAGDIIVVVPEKPIQINRFVLPACVGWNDIPGTFEPATGALIGTVAGWGPSGANGTDSEILLTAEIPYINYINCLGKVGQLTGDKFCAGYDTTLEGKTRGIDSGVGILFLNAREGLYYLRGISTVYDENVNSSISLFTDIQFFLPWMKRLGTQLRIITI